MRQDHNALSSRDIAQLVAVADCGSIRRAADALGMTQPGLSKNIRLIEERLGIAVFDRSTSGAVPTWSGMLLLERGRQVLLDLQAINRDLKEDMLAESGIVRVGCGPVPAPVVAGEVIPRALAAYPGIMVELEVGYPGDLLEPVVRGELDFMIGHVEGLVLPSRLTCHHLVTLSPVMFARKGHPLASVAGLTRADLAGCKLATIHNHVPFEVWLAETVGAPLLEIAFRCDDFDLLGRVVEKSDMLCITSSYVFQQLQRGLDIVALPIVDLLFPHSIHCVQPASRNPSRPAQRILQMIGEALSES